MSNDDRLWAELSTSVVGRSVSGLASAVERAAPQSVGVRWCVAAMCSWRELPLGTRYRSIGVAVIAAVAVHVALVTPRDPVGAWWLILPGLAGAFGAMLIVFSLSMSQGNTDR